MPSQRGGDPGAVRIEFVAVLKGKGVLLIHHFGRTAGSALILLMAGRLPSAAAQDPQYYRNGVVGVEVGRGDSVGASKGTGFVVSVDGDTVSVLTARHLFVESKDRFPGPINVTFYVDRLTTYPATLLTESAVMDLAVLKVEHVPQAIANLMPTYSFRPDNKPPALTERLHVFGGKSQDWQVAAGEISDVGDGDYTDRFRFDGKGTRAGFSGALVMDDGFLLIGIHLGATDNEEAYARAVRMSAAYEVLTQRLGVRLMNKLVQEGAAEAAPATPGLAPVETKDNPRDGLTYVWIPAGSYRMGCSPGDGECYGYEGPSHMVKLTKGFWLGQTTVTVGAWKKYRAATGAGALPTDDSYGRKNLNEASGNDSMPVVALTWSEANRFCEWAAGGGLPTEAEWEYAARAGNTESRYGMLDNIAWYGDNSGKSRIDSVAIWNAGPNNDSYGKALYERGNGPHPVRTKQPNDWKLYDMLGNVWQWTADRFDEKYYGQGDVTDPTGPPAGDDRALRGGSWADGPRLVRASGRVKRGTAVRDSRFGARCAAESLP